MRRLRHRPPTSIFSPKVLMRMAVLTVSLFLLLSLLYRVYQRPADLGAMLHQLVAMTAEGEADKTDNVSEARPSDPVLEDPSVLELTALEQPELAANPALAAANVPQNINPLGLEKTNECTEVDTSLFHRIKDKKPGSAEEAPAIYQMLCVAATMPPERMAAAARRDVFFVNLFNDPELYRGKPIHIDGVLSRLTVREDLAGKNPYGINQVYEAWIFTEHQVENPLVVLLTAIPDGLKPTMEMRENVKLNAFFFKLIAFQTGDQKWHAGPMLIGHDLIWIRVAEGTGGAEAMLLGVGFVALLTLAAGIFWWYSRSDDRLSDQLHHMVRGVTKPEDVPFSPGEMFEEGPEVSDAEPPKSDKPHDPQP